MGLGKGNEELGSDRMRHICRVQGINCPIGVFTKIEYVPVP